MNRTDYGMTIGGVVTYSSKTAVAINPASEEAICEYPVASRDDLEAAVDAAERAFAAWSGTPTAERKAAVSALGDLIEKYRYEFINLLVKEQGKSQKAAQWEIDGSIYWCRRVAQQTLEDEVVSLGDGQRAVTRYVPIGVVGAITPWNFPLLLAIWKVAPALVAGNTVVLKPSPYTPLCTLLFGELAQSVLLPGVLNVVSGDDDLGRWMTSHPAIGKISFTGSTATGKRVMESAASNLKRLTLELGGNDPAIVLSDVDPKKIAADLFWACFANSAQFCVACKRLYVHEGIYDDVLRELCNYASSVRMGNSADPQVELGPLQNKMQFEKVKSLLADTAAADLKFALGGTVTEGQGYFIPVTIVDNPPEDSRCVVEEAFGPVLPVLKYRDEDEAVARANTTSYGLAASVWSEKVDDAERIARRLKAGTVWINQAHVFSPDVAFGGHRQSGLGTENSLHGLAEYCQLQTTIVKSEA